MFRDLGDPTAGAAMANDQIRVGDLVLIGGVSETGIVDCIVTADGFFTEQANVVGEEFDHCKPKFVSLTDCSRRAHF